MWSNKFWRFCLNFWILPRFFGVWAWKLTDLCHSSAPCFWIGQRVPLLLIVLKIYDRPWRCEMDSWLGVNKYPFFELSFERFRPMLWKIECFCDHCYLLNWYGVFLMSWHLFDEFFVVRVSYFLNGFPSLLLAASFFVVRDGVALFERIIRSLLIRYLEHCFTTSFFKFLLEKYLGGKIYQT